MSRASQNILLLFTLFFLLCAATVHALSDTNCIKLNHHTFSWELTPSMKKVSFKAMFMPPYKENDIVIHTSNSTRLLFRVDAEKKTISEWHYQNGQYENLGQQYFTRMMVMPMDEPMKMLHVEFTRMWDHGFSPSVDDDPVMLEYILSDETDLDAKPEEDLKAKIQWYKGMNQCGDGGGHMEMPMAFYWSWEVMMFFKGWMTMSFKEFVPAWLFTFAISFSLQIVLWMFSLKINTSKSSQMGAMWITKSLLKVVSTTLSIAQMLLMMTYNVPLLIGIVLGNLLGWLFSQAVLQKLVERTLSRMQPIILDGDEQNAGEQKPLLVNTGSAVDD